MTGITKFIAVAGAAAFALSVSGCDKIPGAGQSASTDASAVKDAIKADETKWNAQFKAKDFDGLVAHYADNAYFVSPGSPPASGSTAIRKAYASALSDPNFMVTFAADTIDASGDLAYSRGHFTATQTDPASGKVMSGEGTYVTVYKKQADGSWKAVEDVTVAGAPPKPVPPGKPATRAKMVSM